MNPDAVLVKVYWLEGSSAKLHHSAWHDRKEGEIRVGPFPWPWMLEVTTDAGTDQIVVPEGKAMTWIPLGPAEPLWGSR